MKKFVIIISILLTACGTGNKFFEKETFISSSKIIDDIEYTLTVNNNSFTLNDVIKVQASVKNIGESPVTYIGFNGCDDGLHVNVPVQKYERVFLEKNWSQQESKACTEAIETYTLKPGDILNEKKEFIPKINMGMNEIIFVPTDQYSVELTFQKGNMENLEELGEVELSIPITVTGKDDMITKEEAIEIALANIELNQWLANRTGKAVTKQENGSYFILTDGVWVKSSEEHFDEMQKYVPEHSVYFKSNKWIVSYYDKLQGPPHRIEIHIDRNNGEILLVEKFEK